MKTKQIIIAILRKFGLIDPADYLRFLWLTFRNSSNNTKFLKKNLGIKVPPDIMMYEIFGNVDYFNYFRSGEVAAKSILGFIEQYSNIENRKVLEWGSGTARVLAQLAKQKHDSMELFGIDINSEMISWTSNNIKDVAFSLNKAAPPLDFANNTFGTIYNCSVFTHLSKELQKVWLAELLRVLAPNGLLILTVHGDYYAKAKLTEQELKEYHNTGFVVKTAPKEGSRTLAAFQSPAYMRKELLANLEIVAHFDTHSYELAGSQDIWIVRGK